jgi:hypothetical protein
MSEKLQKFQARARELARSGKFTGFRPLAFELQFEDGFVDAVHWTYRVSTQEELDSICREARKQHTERANSADGSAEASSQVHNRS